MRIISISFIGFLLLFFYSCTTGNDKNPMPEINTDLTKNFRILIRANSGVSDPQLIDVSTSSNYNDFKNNIGGFDISKITYKIKNYNAPADMYFDGTLICSNEEETETYDIGDIHKVNLSVLVADSIENTIIPAPENKDKVLAWLDSPGRFKAKSGYTFTNADGSLFIMDDYIGSNFLLVVTFHLIVKTKMK
jgi:hypothetical protein